MSAHSETLTRLIEQGYTAEQAESILVVALASSDVRRARERAVERLIRVHRLDYNRFLAQERGGRRISAAIDDDEFDLPGDEPPDPPDED